jgi:hypothetical protein
MKLKFELHIYPHGAHGLGLAKGAQGEVSRWFDNAVYFIKANG